MARLGRRTGDGTASAVPSSSDPLADVERARETALRLLRVRDRSSADVRRRLRAKGFAAEPVDAVIDRLRETGLLDDGRFAERFAAEAAERRGLAPRRIQGELLRRGVGGEVAAAAAAADDDAEEARALDAARRWAASLGGLPAEARARRLTGYLARRGYDRDLCERVSRAVLGDDEA